MQLGASMKKIIKIGTRKSPLALIQTNIVMNAIKEFNMDIDIELVPMSTKGDERLDISLSSFGGKGAFISEFEDALIQGRLDLAVHSAKDMPIELPYGLDIVAVSRREDPRDVIITRKGSNIVLSEESIVGTSSLRRQMQIQEQYHVQVKLLRGNVNTRLNKLKNKEYDAIILAAAGLKRLDKTEGTEYNFEYLPIDTFIPAAGQGIIAVEGRKEKEIVMLLDGFNNEETLYSLQVEREVLRLLNAGCNEPIGVYSSIQNEQIELNIIFGHEGRIIRQSGTALLKDRFKLANELSHNILLKLPSYRNV